MVLVLCGHTDLRAFYFAGPAQGPNVGTFKLTKLSDVLITHHFSREGAVIYGPGHVVGLVTTPDGQPVLYTGPDSLGATD